ncbi:hypothetical protein JHK87_052747 [Glycine soja]|nr:hypothetical protein JHK87_052747 [Glycine soja]
MARSYFLHSRRTLRYRGNHSFGIVAPRSIGSDTIKSAGVRLDYAEVSEQVERALEKLGPAKLNMGK